MDYLLRSDGTDVRVGWRPELGHYLLLVHEDYYGQIHRYETETAQEIIDMAQDWVPKRISSVWVYRLINDRTAPPRPKAATRHHEAQGGTSVYAPDA